MPIEMIPPEAYPWILAAFLTGFTGREGIKHALSIIETLNATDSAYSDPDDDSDDDTDDPEDNHETVADRLEQKGRVRTRSEPEHADDAHKPPSGEVRNVTYPNGNDPDDE